MFESLYFLKRLFNFYRPNDMERENFDYTIEATNRLEINGECFYTEKTQQQWWVNNFYDDDHFFNVVINVIKFPQNNLPETQPLFRLLSQLNPILEHVHLRMADNGDIQSVVNEKEIYNRWERVKEQLLAQYKDTKPVKNMIEKLNASYYWSRSCIRGSLLYFIFLSQYRKDDEFEGELPSILHEGEIIDINVSRFKNENVLNSSNEKTRCLHGEGKVRRRSTLKKVYNQQIKPLTGADFSYNYIFDCHYDFDCKNASLIEAHLKEQASDKYVYESTVTFKFIPQ